MSLSASPMPVAKVWIDLDNTPHVPFFAPIIEELVARGLSVVVTARDAFQVCALADQRGLRYARVGRHHGRWKLAKAAGLVLRAAQLLPFARRERPDLAVSHGARSQLLVANWLGCPSLLIDDYEFSRYPVGFRPAWMLVPEVIPAAALPCPADRVFHYPGLKEDVYASRFQPQPGFRAALGFGEGEILVVVRPPATEAHYHNVEGEALFAQVMDQALACPEVRVVLLPRHARQGLEIRQRYPQWFASGRTLVPAQALDGLNLLWHADLVVSGGGTMNREAAALGVPVYSIFRGPMGAVDLALQRQGRLTLLTSVEEVRSRLRFTPRSRAAAAVPSATPALSVIVSRILALLPASAVRPVAPVPVAP